jgi:antitoxin component YwqK of YwqJK toxin-antitoxin module
MRQIQEKPDFVPQAAVWNADEYKWEVSARDENGEREGERLLYREDGRLYSRAHFRAGVLDGPFCVYHPSGQVAREGSYLAGAFQGTVVAHASDTPSPEHLRSCCVPENATELRAVYQAGNVESETFYDRQGRALLDDGTLLPEKPAHLDPGVRFDESLRRWRIDMPIEERGARLIRYWSADGALIEDIEYRAGRRVSRVFAADGSVRLECGYIETNLLDGPYRRRFVTEGDSPYEDERIAEERGTFERGEAVGHWAFLERDGNLVRAVERGPAFSREQASAVFADAEMDRAAAAHWRELAPRYLVENRLREALCAAARAAACEGDRALLLQCLTDNIVPLHPREREHRGERLAASADATMTAALDALVTGVDAAAAFRTLAAVTTGTSHAARDFIEASLLLAPDRKMSHLTRALVRVEIGDDRGALDDADCIPSQAAAEFVRSYVRVAFPDFSFRPTAEGLASDADAMAVTPEQPLDAVQHTVQVYATRIEQLRRAVLQRVPRGRPNPSWLPPDLSFLLPREAASLRCFDATIIDETDGGPEKVDVRIDERIDVDHRSVLLLLRAARFDWCALSWLCWSVGRDEVALPREVVPRPQFSAAASLAVSRFWRAQDRLTTGGLIARSQGVAGFDWEGMHIDEMPLQFAEIAAAEYLELRSMFLWLASRDNLSPFQSDLRLG